MIDLRTGKEMTRGGFLKGILAAGVAPSIISSALAQGVSVGGIAGSANSSVARGMMRNVGARNAAMIGGESLPYDAEVDWISGSERFTFIDSGISTFDQNLSISGEISEGVGNKANSYCFGSYAPNNRRFGFNILSDANIYQIRTELRLGTYSNYLLNRSDIQDYFTFEVNGITNKAYINDLLVWSNPSGNTHNDSNIGVLSSLYAEKEPEGGVGPLMKTKWFKINNSTGLIMHLIPVRVGNVGYFYDKISKKLFGAEGEGYLIYGPDKT